ncbi:tautomerase [Endozoicomonas montiporae]|uniref:Tautomerase n=2 Tax=Endozoicomonas montiporae TaxID=1027273 RepID=A0A081NB63_9GAMM|nr:hypothetical protein [Endozoicomonas montiporae]AMO56599.1 tautomerase [Endozoicomonas montiporae CL-33]KEQ15686.1 tautomerase [Endozoicomonas montiporae]
MPHLQFEFNKPLNGSSKVEFSNQVRAIFARIMDTGTDHIAISIREVEPYNLSIGRARPEDSVCLMNLDIREGRTISQRRELAIDYMTLVESLFEIPPAHQYITFTQHPGEDFHLIEKYLAEWAPKEDPLA